MKKILKICFLGHVPATDVLPKKFINSRSLRKNELRHPAPWVRTLCRALTLKENIRLKVFTHSRDISRIINIEHEGVNYTFIPKYEPKRLDPYHLYTPAIIQFTTHVNRYKPDVVQGFGTESVYGLLSVIQKQPKIVFIQGIQEKLAPYYDMNKIKIFLRKILEQYVIRNVDGLIAETEFAMNWAKDLNKKVKIKIIPHGYTEHFLLNQPKYKNHRMVCVGTLSKIKGCLTVLEAYKMLEQRNEKLFKDTQLCFIGDGPLKLELKKKAQDYKIINNISFKGRLTHEQTGNELEKACLLVIGSKMDTSPNVITEAHCSGIPVIGTNAGGIPSMIENGKDGFIVDIDNSVDMSKYMELLLSNLKLCQIMGEKGREKVKKLNDPSIIAEEHIEFYKKILGR